MKSHIERTSYEIVIVGKKKSHEKIECELKIGI